MCSNVFGFFFPPKFVNKQSGIKANVLIYIFVFWSLFLSEQDGSLKTVIF